MNIEENDMVRPVLWRHLCDDGEDLARHARRFITGHLAAVPA